MNHYRQSRPGGRDEPHTKALSTPSFVPLLRCLTASPSFDLQLAPLFWQLSSPPGIPNARKANLYISKCKGSWKSRERPSRAGVTQAPAAHRPSPRCCPQSDWLVTEGLWGLGTGPHSGFTHCPTHAQHGRHRLVHLQKGQVGTRPHPRGSRGPDPLPGASPPHGDD